MAGQEIIDAIRLGETQAAAEARLLQVERAAQVRPCNHDAGYCAFDAPAPAVPKIPEAPDPRHAVLRVYETRPFDPTNVLITGTVQTDPNGLNAHTPGAKLDAGKPWAYTVLRGFWPVVRALQLNTKMDRELHFALDTWLSGTETSVVNLLVFTVDPGSITQWLRSATMVGTFGAKKYSRDGWLSVPDAMHRYQEALGRHVLALLGGETIDPESGLLHEAHIHWGLFALATLEARASAAAQKDDNAKS